MEKNLINQIEFELRKNLTNGVCLSGSNITYMKYLLKKKYVSKKEMNAAICLQMTYLEQIENSLKNVLNEINKHNDGNTKSDPDKN